MIDLVLTHLTHPWGPPWTLETLGDHWRPLATMPENGQNGQNPNSFCNDLVWYNSQLWETATLKFWLWCILERPSHGSFLVAISVAYQPFSIFCWDAWDAFFLLTSSFTASDSSLQTDVPLSSLPLFHRFQLFISCVQNIQYDNIISKPSYYPRNSIALNVLTNPNFFRAYFTSMCQSQWPWLASSSSSPQYWVWLAGISVSTGFLNLQQIIWSSIVV